MKKTAYYKIPEIIIKKLYRRIDNDEQELLDHWLSLSNENIRLYEELKNRKNFLSQYQAYKTIKNDLAWERINAKLQKNTSASKRALLLPAILKYAAILLIPLAIASVYYIYDTNRSYTLAEIIQEDNPLNLQEATLVLDDGRLLDLTKINPDTLTKISGARIDKEIATINYNKDTDEVKSPNLNTLVVPKARVYSIVLSDGSRVWVNAASSLKFPSVFTDKERKVELTGEAYFEIARNEQKPFIVSVDGMDVEVLGTEFNVSAYRSDESIQTTLVQGAVKIKVASSEMKMNPGEQVLFSKNEKKLEKKEVNTLLYTSWKEGKYIFEYQDLESVMKKLGRWHNIEVFYEDESTKQYHFTGTLKKYDDISKSLRIIELATNIEFEVTKDVVVVKGVRQ